MCTGETHTISHGLGDCTINNRGQRGTDTPCVQVPSHAHTTNVVVVPWPARRLAGQSYSYVRRCGHPVAQRHQGLGGVCLSVSTAAHCDMKPKPKPIIHHPSCHPWPWLPPPSLWRPIDWCCALPCSPAWSPLSVRSTVLNTTVPTPYSYSHLVLAGSPYSRYGRTASTAEPHYACVRQSLTYMASCPPSPPRPSPSTFPPAASVPVPSS